MQRVEHDAKVHDLEHVDAQVAEVIVNCRSDLFAGRSRIPRALRTPFRPHFGRNHEFRWIGVKRLANELVRDMGAIDIARVDVIDPAFDRFAQHRYCRTSIPGWPQHTWTRELHRSISESRDLQWPYLECSGSFEVHLFHADNYGHGKLVR